MGDEPGIRRRIWGFVVLGTASFALLAVLCLGGILLGNRATPDSTLGWATLLIFVVPSYLLLGLLGEMVVEVIVGLLKTPFERSPANEESRQEVPQTEEGRTDESPWRGLRALSMLLVGLCLVPVLYFALVFIYGH